MSDEQGVIAACLMDRNAYEQVQKYDAASEFSQLGKFWLRHIGDYYDRDQEAEKADRSLVQQFGINAADSRHADILSTYYENLPIVGVSSSNVVAAILELQRKNTGLRLAAILSDPEAPETDRIKELIERYSELLVACETGLSKLNYLDYDSLEKVYDPELIIPLYPKVLGRKCLGGGAMPGHHILIFGRPESGKTLFAINLAAGVAFSGKRVLYIGNEESVATHGIRLSCRLAESDIRDYNKRQSAISARARKRGRDNVTFLELAPGTITEIDEAITDISPHVVIIDQLAGIDVGESKAVQSIDKAARAFRTLALRHHIVAVSIGQAGDRTERSGQLPPAWLSMSDVYGSRTGLPAQVDMMIGIGYDEEMFSKNIRACSLPKNKIGGDHNGFKIRIDKQQSKVTGLGERQDG